MFHSISWQTFFGFLALLVVVYYLYIIIAYFRKDLLALFHNKQRNTGFASKPSSDRNLQNPSISPIQAEIPFHVIHEFMEDLKRLFAFAVKTKMVKEELIQAIHSKLEVYPQIAGTDVQHDVNVHIRDEVKEQCGIDLSPEEIKQIWAS